MTETIHMLILQHQILKAQKSLNHDEYCYHIKQFIMTSANSYCNIHYPYTFHMLCIYFPLGSSTLFLPCLSFFFIDQSHLKADAIHLSDSSLFHKRWIMGQLNVQAVTAENEEHIP